MRFAVALLSEEALEMIGIPFSNAGTTALSQTLLHIACLPYREEEIANSPKCLESIHETRELHDSQFRKHSLENMSYKVDGEKYFTHYDNGDGKPRDIPDELHGQEAICKRVVHELGFDSIGWRDSHGNTALHYLAGSWFLNERLIAELRSWTPGEFSRQNEANIWGHTPKDLMEENLAMRNDKVRDGGRGFIVSRGMKQRLVFRGRR